MLLNRKGWLKNSLEQEFTHFSLLLESSSSTFGIDFLSYTSQYIWIIPTIFNGNKKSLTFYLCGSRRDKAETQSKRSPVFVTSSLFSLCKYSGKALSIWKSLAQNGRRHHESKKKTNSDGRESQSVVHCKHCFINKSRRFSLSSPKQFLSKLAALLNDYGKEKSIRTVFFGFCWDCSHKLAPIIELRQTCKHFAYSFRGHESSCDRTLAERPSIRCADSSFLFQTINTEDSWIIDQNADECGWIEEKHQESRTQLLGRSGEQLIVLILSKCCAQTTVFR